MKRGQSKERVRKVSASDYQALAAFRHALRQFLAFSEEAARVSGLPPQQHQALLAIKGQPSGAAMTIGDLAEHLLIRHHSAVELVKRLVQAKLAVKSEGELDRRQVTIMLTAKAETILEELSAIHLAELKRSGPLLIELAGHLAV